MGVKEALGNPANFVYRVRDPGASPEVRSVSHTHKAATWWCQGEDGLLSRVRNLSTFDVGVFRRLYQEHLREQGIRVTRADKLPDADLHAPGAKDDREKPRVDLVTAGFPRALLAVAEVATFGAKKYTDGGWQHVTGGQARYEAALGRHTLLAAVEEKDPDSGLLHLAHRAWNALATLELYLRDQEKKGTDRVTP